MTPGTTSSSGGTQDCSGAVRRSTVQCGTVQRSTLPTGTVQRSTLPTGTVQWIPATGR